jgi:hypothetical protein
MKRSCAIAAILCLVLVATPGYPFFDYFFSGGASRDAIDNSAVGELRAWWTGNPIYNFNPYYAGQQQQPPSGPQGQPQQETGDPQPSVNFYPPQSQGAYYGQGAPQGGQPMYNNPGGYQQQYGGAPVPQYQAQPQAYQQPPQGYQQPPQAYQYQQAPQGYTAAQPQAYQQPPQGYPAGGQQAYQQAPPGYGYQAPPQAYQGGVPAGYQGEYQQ